MSDKAISEAVDDFFDVRSLAAVLIGFVLTEWVEVILVLIVGMEPMTLAIIWPIIFVVLVVVLANAGRKTNGELKKEEFRKEIERLRDELSDK